MAFRVSPLPFRTYQDKHFLQQCWHKAGCAPGLIREQSSFVTAESPARCRDLPQLSAFAAQTHCVIFSHLTDKAANAL